MVNENIVAFFARMGTLSVGKEEIVVTMAAAMSSRWRQQEWTMDGLKRAGGGMRRRRRKQ